MSALWSLKSILMTTVSPELYLKAGGEMLAIICGISWIITLMSNNEYVKSNPLKDVFGYNNVCVGFDQPPASYICFPLFIFYAYLGIRYTLTDTQRAVLARNKLTKTQYNLTLYSNAFYGIMQLMFPMLVLITPDEHVAFHTYTFVVFVASKVICYAANFYETDDDWKVPTSSKVWLGTLIACVGFAVLFVTIDLLAYDFKEGGKQEPAIPWYVLCFCDVLFLVLVSMASRFLPPGPAIIMEYELAGQGNDDEKHPAKALENNFIRPSNEDNKEERTSTDEPTKEKNISKRDDITVVDVDSD